jgi:hypothetical protein
MDVYRIGVSIVLANGVSPILAIIGKDLLGLHTSTQAIQKNFGGWTAALVGVGGMLGGTMILGAMTKLAEKASEFQDAMIKVSQLNPKVAHLVQNGELRQQAFQIGAQLGMKAEDIVKIYGGVYGVLQDPEEAMAITPAAARYARLMEARHPGSHPEGTLNTLMRAGELSGRLTDEKGAIDPKKVEEWFDMAARLEAATHGQVNAETLLGLAQQGGGVALRGLSQEGYEHMAIVAQMMGGQRAGTSLLSLRSQLTGTMMKRSAEAMEHYGLLKPGEYSTEGGHVTMTDAAAHRLLNLVNRDPMAFVNDVVDKLEAKGITNKEDQMIALQQILGRQTTQRMVADMLLARQQIARETAGLEQGATVKQGLNQYADESLSYNMHNVSTAWSNLLTSLGGPQGEHFVSVLKAITGALNWATQFSEQHPKLIKMVGEALIGVAVGLMAVGGAALLALFGPTGLIMAIVGAVGALVAANWTAVANGFKELGAILWKDWTEKWNGLTSGLSKFWDLIVSMYDKVKHFFAPAQTPSDQKGTDEFVKGLKEHVQLESFHPGVDDKRHNPLTLSLNIDGRTLAQAVSGGMGDLYRYDTNSPASNGSGLYGA